MGGGDRDGLWLCLAAAPVRWLEALAIGVAVASHFVADLLVHVRDLPVLGSAGDKWGLGLWQHRERALGVELATFVLPAIWWWQAPWQAQADRRRRATLLIAMSAILIVTFYVPTPPTPWAMALTGLSTYVIAALAAAWASKTASLDGAVAER